MLAPRLSFPLSDESRVNESLMSRMRGTSFRVRPTRWSCSHRDMCAPLFRPSKGWVRPALNHQRASGRRIQYALRGHLYLNLKFADIDKSSTLNFLSSFIRDTKDTLPPTNLRLAAPSAYQQQPRTYSPQPPHNGSRVLDPQEARWTQSPPPPL